MYNLDGGYNGYSMSNRAVRAYEDGEMPLSKWNKSLILDEVNQLDLDMEIINLLKKLTTSELKAVALEYSSWHHTSKHYNKTDFYCLDESKLEELTIDDINIIIDSRVTKKPQKVDYKFGIIKVQVWGGTRKRPKIIGYETEIGLIIGNWLYHRNGKYKTNANKVEWIKEYNCYDDLVANHKEYKNTKRIFNKLIKEIKK